MKKEVASLKKALKQVNSVIKEEDGNFFSNLFGGSKTEEKAKMRKKIRRRGSKPTSVKSL